jgi:hypothetical protein
VSDPGTVTDWIGRLGDGNPTVAQPLWERYFHRMVDRARRQLAGTPRRRRRGGRGAERPQQLLPRRRAASLPPAGRPRRPLAAAAGGDRPQGQQPSQARYPPEARAARRECPERGGVAPADAAGGSPLARLPSREPTPEYAAQLADTWRLLFGLLRDPELETVALMKMQGYHLREIAARVGCVPRTVQRQLQLIRHIWEREGAM